jgi:hypothetical protein
MWIFALDRLGEIDSRYRAKAIALVRDIHPAFVVPGIGVIWKMREDLSGPYPGFGLGALDASHGLVVYRLLLWMSHLFADEPWAVVQRARALAMLDREWVDPPGYFWREPGHRHIKFAFTNDGVSLGLTPHGGARAGHAGSGPPHARRRWHSCLQSWRADRVCEHWHVRCSTEHHGPGHR